jgi:hypothetical protein
MIRQITLFSFTMLAASTAFVSCKKETTEDTAPTYEVPSTYNFANADTTESKQHLAMLGELTTYIKTTHSNSAAPVLDAQKLKDMFANVNNYFSTPALNSAASLKSNMYFNAIADIEASFDAAAPASVNAGDNPTGTTAYNGHAGKLINGTRYILVDENGLEFKEVAEKGIMGSVFYYQASTILNNIASFDNTTEVNGLTDQERAWDQAFAYFGVPITFPQTTTGLKNWGSYCNAVSNSLAGNSNNGPYSLNSQIMNAWIGGRAAISNGDNVRRNMNAAKVLELWEKVIAGRFITYTKGAINNIAETATFHHNASEAVGFILAFKYNSSKSISDSDIESLLNNFKTGNEINLYNVTVSDLNNAIEQMAALFDLDASKL